MLSAVAHLTQVIHCSDFWNFAGAVVRLFSSINTEPNQIITFETIQLLIISMEIFD